METFNNELAEQAGWKFLTVCRCIGPRTLKYFKGNMILYFAPKHGWTKIKQRGSTIHYLKNVHELDEFFNAEIAAQQTA